MMDSKSQVSTVDDYIAAFPPNVQKILQDIRATIKAAAPAAREKIAYDMPAFHLNRNLVFFAAYKNHIGFYPSANALEVFGDDLAGFKSSKGAVQFPIDKPMPLDLIRRIVEFRVLQNIQHATDKAMQKRKK